MGEKVWAGMLVIAGEKHSEMSNVQRPRPKVLSLSPALGEWEEGGLAPPGTIWHDLARPGTTGVEGQWFAGARRDGSGATAAGVTTANGLEWLGTGGEGRR